MRWPSCDKDPDLCDFKLGALSTVLGCRENGEKGKANESPGRTGVQGWGRVEWDRVELSHPPTSTGDHTFWPGLRLFH